jgi:hypothetical protein
VSDKAKLHSVDGVDAVVRSGRCKLYLQIIRRQRGKERKTIVNSTKNIGIILYGCTIDSEKLGDVE